MYLTAFLHRDQLFEITNRWLSDRLLSTDPLAITRIITYDSFAAWEMLLVFIDSLLGCLHDGPIQPKKIADKKDFKDFICTPSLGCSERSKALISNYRRMSEFYYVGSPMAGYIYHDASSRVMAVSRFKRVKRIAEKASRYASLYLSKEVQTAAIGMPDETTDMPPEDPGPSIDRMVRAETQVMQRLRASGVALPVRAMTIRDILGIKIIDTGFGEGRLEAAVSQHPGAQIIEKERHTGNYNAVHYVIDLDADFDRITRRFLQAPRKADYSRRGLPEDHIDQDFIGFLKTGANNIQLDLIFTTFEELIESEIGRSMHESRIFRQRQEQSDWGNIPTNVEYIIEYLMAVGLSPVVRIEEVPIKVWGRYLPDTLSYRIRKLYGMPEYSLIEI